MVQLRRHLSELTVLAFSLRFVSKRQTDSVMGSALSVWPEDHYQLSLKRVFAMYTSHCRLLVTR
jgi:hypothetical protein